MIHAFRHGSIGNLLPWRKDSYAGILLEVISSGQVDQYDVFYGS